jgi:DNA polymerase-3 subunit epsilon/ATP-dependent DNA helicase DinG
MRQAARQLEEVLGPGGLLGKVVEIYDWRPQQQEMAREVLGALFREQFLLLEAPTGVGKTLAYLLPAALYARRRHEPVVISSYTRALQDQILLQEAPRLRRLIHPDLRVVALKGRGNYLCRRRWELFVAEEGSGPDGRRIVERLETWVFGTDSGDFAEAPDPGARAAWAFARIGGDARFCRSRFCRAEDGCFHKRARREAHDADLVVVNHSLLIADALTGGVLPEHRGLILDEAHLLPEAALEPLSWRCSERALLDRVRGIGGAGEPGVTDRLRRAQRLLPGRVAARNLTRRVRGLEEETRAAIESVRALVGLLRGREEFPAEGERRRYGTGGPFDAWLSAAAEGPLAVLDRLGTTARDLLAATAQEKPKSDEATELDDLLEACQGLVEELAEQTGVLRRLSLPEGRERVYCLEASRAEGAALAALPLSTGPALRDLILKRHAGVVMTSATLASAGGFGYFAEQVGLEADEARALQLSSPFALERQLRTLVPSYAVDPRAEGYASFLGRALGELAAAVPRKILALFTAHATLERVAEALRRDPALGQVTVLAQGRDGARTHLIEAFRAAPRAVLLGTASFWHGVDFPGQELEVLVLTRLPFPVPADPRVEAISQALEEEGRSSFDHYALPEAVLRFRQGLGRLIRRGSDRGVCIVLDPRLVRARYRPAFWAALPGPPEVVDSPAALIAGVRAWFDTGGEP